MKYPFFIPFTFLLGLITLLNGCQNNEDEDCIQTETAVLSHLEVLGDTLNSGSTASYSIVVGETLPIEITYFIQNNCGSFQALKSEGSDVSVELLYEGCICGEILLVETKRFTFEATQEGVRTLRFNSVDGKVTTLTVEIN